MSAFRLTEQYSNELLGLSGLPLLQAVEAIVNKHRTKLPRWIPISERMPTAEDGMAGSSDLTDNHVVMGMGKTAGVGLYNWHSIPDLEEIVAWCRIPDYSPPPPTPKDPLRQGFERWADAELASIKRYPDGPYVSESTRCAWAAWQARAATTEESSVSQPDPVREEIRRLLQAFDDSRKAAAAGGGLCKTLERESRELISKLRAALTGGEQS